MTVSDHNRFQYEKVVLRVDGNSCGIWEPFSRVRYDCLLRLIELRLKIPVNSISVMSGLLPPREREIEKKNWID